MKKHFSIQNITFILTLILVVFFLGKNLMPSNTMFEFHDETQGARVQEFTVNLQNGIVPPRVAPHFSFHMGYPVFNFYAPFSYWMTSSLHILGLDIADSLKVSFLLAITIAFMGMYAFLKLYFKFLPSVIGAVLYVASPWLAAEIFVRGNLGEVWFWGLLPLALYAIYEQDEYQSPVIFAATVFILSCILTVHNIFSLLFVPIAVIYIWITCNKLKSYVALGLALLFSSYFLLPAIAESSLTYAREVATMTKYSDHFLCINQLWSAPYWGFGGSAPGCLNDGMAFMIGKAQIILGILGMGLFVLQILYRIYRSKNITKKENGNNSPIGIYTAVLVMTIGSLFLITYPSQTIWELFKPILSLFQFPWRFLFFLVFGFSFFSTFIMNKFKFKGAMIVISVIGLYVLISTSNKYFYKQTISKSEYNAKYLNEQYIRNTVAYKIPEYLPKTANYKVWRQFENKDIYSNAIIRTIDGHEAVTQQNDLYNKVGQTSSEKFLLNIHYVPFWEIRINNQIYKPTSFDSLGRPQISTLPGKKTVEITYKQTPIEVAGNVITIITFFLVMLLLYNSKYLWKHMKIIKK